MNKIYAEVSRTWDKKLFRDDLPSKTGIIMDYLSLFQMPTPMKITGRSSSITNAFVISIIPAISPTAGQVQEALEILGMSCENVNCSYCGDKPTEWDHLRPIVLNKKPTGFISEIYNLVPACGKCNQSKGNRPWAEWIISEAKLSPKSRGINDLKSKMTRLRKYEERRQPIKLEFKEIVSSEKWNRHWENCEKIQVLLKEAQSLAAEIKEQVDVEFYKN